MASAGRGGSPTSSQFAIAGGRKDCAIGRQANAERRRETAGRFLTRPAAAIAPRHEQAMAERCIIRDAAQAGNDVPPPMPADDGAGSLRAEQRALGMQDAECRTEQAKVENRPAMGVDPGSRRQHVCFGHDTKPLQRDKPRTPQAAGGDGRKVATQGLQAAHEGGEIHVGVAAVAMRANQPRLAVERHFAVQAADGQTANLGGK